ncbi:nuclear transport factor 2 family protein [Chloroflexota bacterium]
MTTMENLVTRVQLLEDIEAIKQLKVRYARTCDDNYNAQEIAKLFTEDAVWDGRPLSGIYKGRQAIYERFEQGSSFAFAEID